MTERYTKNNWKKNRHGTTPAEQALDDKIVYNDGVSKLYINKSGDYFKEHGSKVKTSILNRNHPATVTLLIMILLTAFMQVFYQMIMIPFEISSMPEKQIKVVDDIVFIFPFVVFVILTSYVVYVWIRENKSKKEFCKNYMEYLVDKRINNPESGITDKEIAESKIRQEMKNQINICDNGLRTDGKHRMGKELSIVVCILITVGFGLIILNIVLPFWISMLCQMVLSWRGLLG